MNTGAMMSSRRPPARAVAAATPKRSWEVVCVAALMLMLLAAYGCGQNENDLLTWHRESGIVFDDESVDNPCGYVEVRAIYGDLYEHFLHWVPDGSRLVFDIDDTIWTLDIEGARLLQVADTVPDDDRYANAYFGHYADVSPDGSRIVYSTCEYPLDGYEIATVRVDGTDQRRLTKDGHFDHYPVWSPDGKRAALVKYRLWADVVDMYPIYDWVTQRRAQLSILPVKSSAGRLLDVVLRRGDVRRLEATSRLALAPPVWSPGGEHLAFIVNEGEGRQYRYRGRRAYRYTRVLHAVRADGSGLARIGETTALPTWSPDGDELAYATVDGDVPALYAVRPDGTGRRLIWSGGADEGFAPISQVLWSPDGSEILFFTNESYLVRPDGDGLRRLGIPRNVPDARAAWSPDGSRIAIYFPYLQIVTVSRDGAELLVHAEAANIGTLPPRLGANPPEASPPRGDLRALDPPLTIALDRLDCSAPATYVYASWLENCKPKGEDGS